MKDVFKGVVSLLLILVMLLGLGWIIAGNNLAMFSFFAPKAEQVRRETFEQSKAYNQGMVQEIQNMQMEYVKATPSQKDALASIILHRVADFDVEKLPPDLYRFINQLKSERGLR